MKTRPSNLSKSRWLAYAAAGAATALVGSPEADAEIHYSGTVDVDFDGTTMSQKFPLDRPGAFIGFFHNGFAGAYFRVGGLVGEGFRGHGSATYFNVAKLTKGRVVSVGHFEYNKSGGYASIARTYRPGPWTRPGIGFVGFRFDNGSGPQYGWARIRIDGSKNSNTFTVIDYAYGDPGDPIKAGQTSNDTAKSAPAEGSLGLLALGAAGLLAWRERRDKSPE